MPDRIRLSRESGARMPANSKSVARPSKWGNPFKIIRDHATWTVDGMGRRWVGYATVDDATMAAVELFRYAWEHRPTYMAHLDITELAGFNLGCFCPLDKPCHADVLLELANPKPTPVGTPLEIPPGSFLVCDGCGEATPLMDSRQQVRSMAQLKGWKVDVGPESHDYCTECAAALS